MKRDEYFDKNKDKITHKAISDDSEESYKTPQVLIDQLFHLYYAGKFSEQLVKEQIETVLIAGNETSALTLSYTILLLAMHTEIQDRLYNELHSVKKSKQFFCSHYLIIQFYFYCTKVYDTQDEHTTYEKIQQLPYLDMVLKEGDHMLFFSFLTCCFHSLSYFMV